MKKIKKLRMILLNFLLQIKGLPKYRKCKLQLKKLLVGETNPLYICDNDKKIWNKSFLNLSLITNKRGLTLAQEFYKSNICVISEKRKFFNDKDLILICLAKNECDNLKKIYNYYTNLGVNNFVYIDNGSNDNTIEYFKKIENVNLFSVKDEYTSIRRQAWINKIISRYGFNKWYLVIDSDEYLAFNECEKNSISDAINFFNSKKIERVRALMVDMYPKRIIFNNDNIDFLKKYNLFDYNTYGVYHSKESMLFDCLNGGMRGRLFSEGDESKKPWLTKYPLLLFKKGDIQFQSHMSYPFEKNFDSDCYLVLMHYKFLPSDSKKYQDRVKKGNFSLGSWEYKRYIEQMKKGYIDFYDSKCSKKYITSESFYQIKLLSKIPWK